MEKSDTPYIAQMALNLGKIRRFIEGSDLPTFLADEKTQGAVLMQFLQTGELAKRVSQKTKHAIDIEWPKIAGLRNLIVHEYYGVLLPVLWEIIQNDLPETERALADYLEMHPFLV